MLKYIQLFLLNLFCVVLLTGQDLTQLNKNPFQLSGSLSMGSSLYGVKGIENRQSPFSYFIAGRPVVSVFGIDLPFNFTYRNQEGSVSRPFNRFAVNPRYKWVSLSLGRMSTNMHKYVNSGINLSGFGLELSPGNFRFRFERGKLLNPFAQIDSLVGGAELLSTYERNVNALLVGYEKNQNGIELSLFKAKDDINSITDPEVLDRSVKPAENLGVGIMASISPIKEILLTGNLGLSGITDNQNSIPALDSMDVEELNRTSKLLYDNTTVNVSSKFVTAYDVEAQLKLKKLTVGGSYKRVDPLYKSLGSFYLQEDVSNLLLKLKFRIGRFITFNGRGGVQKNNLNNFRESTNTRNIYNINLNVSPSQKFQTSFRYSNFQNERSAGLVAINDSLRFTRTTQSYGLTPRVSFGSTERKSSISLSANFQDLSDLLNDEDTGRSIKNYTGNLRYTIRFKAKGLQLGLGVLSNRNVISDQTRDRLGGRFNVSKTLLERKLRMSGTMSFTLNQLDGIADGKSITGRTTFNYRINEKVSSNVAMSYLNRSGGIQVFSEFRATAKVSIVFNKN